ncbi:MAG: EF-P lysine aminoacylase EpmA [Pseudomonadota bacterium]|nr:EF-P lysine aminoacylase EpmA [Pseudomonadota bacterium]
MSSLPLRQLSLDINKHKKKAIFIRQIRDYFYKKDVLEVFTPLLTKTSVTDPNINSIKCSISSCEPNFTGFLQTSPEYAMKRLLVAGSGCIYQICPAFRDDEASAIHAAEFTMLEWYRLGYNYKMLMAEVVELLRLFIPNLEVKRKTYKDIFSEFLNINIDEVSRKDLQNIIKDKNGCDINLSSKDEYLDALMSLVIQPQLKDVKALLVYDFPVNQAALSKVSTTDKTIAERFELYMSGIEIANGYSELTDTTEMKQRFHNNNQHRLESGQEVMELDQDFLRSMSMGLVECAGVAVGIERLFMIICEDTKIF